MIALKNLAHLIRWHKPVGTLLLFWPCAFALALFQAPLFLYLLFLGGSFVMRSAGCIINDLWDKNIDAQVKRTQHRPLAAGKVSVKTAMMCLVVLLLMGLFILLQLPRRAIFVGMAALPLVILYPLAKRFFVWPQVILALTFNAGVLVVAATMGQPVPWILYGACVCWTLAYDTLYACQDRADDERIALKSGAVLFGSSVKTAVIALYGLTFVLWAMMSPVIVALGILWCFFLYRSWSPTDSGATDRWFSYNGALGAVVFVIV